MQSKTKVEDRNLIQEYDKDYFYSGWIIFYDPKPIASCAFDWTFHKDIEGEQFPIAHTSYSVRAAMDAIDFIEAEKRLSLNYN